MGDLIDRSSLSELSFSHAIHQDCIVYVPIGEVKRQIKDAPIAYDVEAVVAELEALRKEKVETIGGYCQSTISKAISIVRGKE